MEDTDEILGSLALDPESMTRQFLNLASLFNIFLALIMGFLVVLVYLASSSRDNRDRNLFTIIPVLSILMAVMMRIEAPQMVVFFGIFGILSLIRFRSDLTDQKGITFILFAVIEGVLVGVNSYLLALVAWLVVGGSILLSRRLFTHPLSYRLVARIPKIEPECRKLLEAWLDEQVISWSLHTCSSATDYSSKSQEWDGKFRIEYTLYPEKDAVFMSLFPALGEKMKEWGMEMELKRLD